MSRTESIEWITSNYVNSWGCVYGGAYEASASTTNFGFNLGGGIDFALSEKLVLNGQLKYMLASDWSRLILSAGVAYKF
jgi:outer membrane protein X